MKAVAARVPKKPLVLVKKSQSLFMKICAFVLGILGNKRFLQDYWTTIHHTLYVPTKYNNDLDWGTPEFRRRHDWLMAHEGTHAAQFEKYWLLFNILYVGPAPFLAPVVALLWILCIWFPLWVPALIVTLVMLALTPLTAGFAYFRWLLEREAYLPRMIQLHRKDPKKGMEYLNGVVRNLKYDYVFTWPEKKMKVWFLRQLERADQDPDFDGSIR